MVTLTQAEQQLFSVKSQLQETKSSLEKQRKEIESRKVPRRSLAFQQEVIAAEPRRFAGRTERIVEEMEESKRAGLSQIFQKEREIEKFEKEQVVPYEQTIKTAKSKQKVYTDFSKKINSQIRRLDAGESLEYDESYARTLPKELRKEYQRIVEDSQNRAKFQVRQERRLGKVMSTEGLSGFVGGVPTFSSGYQGVSTREGVVVENVPSQMKPTSQTQGTGLGVESSKTYPILEVAPAEKPKGLEGFQSSLMQKQQKLAISSIRGSPKPFQEIGTGLLLSGTSTLLAARHPIKSIKRTATGAYGLGKSLLTGGKLETGGVGKVIEETPGVAVGFVAGEYATLKAPTLIAKGSDVLRTMRKTEVKDVDVIAPEYFKGQNYPMIKKGETAGELLKEFKPMEELGEIKPAGFTAAPSPLKGTLFKNPLIKPGSSELPGLYQAPKLSPKFLKVSGEKKLFGLNFWETLRPSAFRITPESYELVPTVAKSQKSIGDLSRARKFFYTSAEKGKSYIPFIKVEKESVIPFGTELVRKPSKYYFKFEGRRIPIFEYETIYGKGSGLKDMKKFTGYDIYKKSSYGKLRSRPLLSPYELRISKFRSSMSKSIGTSSKKSYFKSSLKPAKSSKRIISSGRSYIIPNYAKGYYGGGYGKSYGGISGSSYGDIGYGYGGGYGTGISTPTIKLVPKKEFKMRRPSIITGGKVFQPTKYTPSFTGIFLDIKGKKPGKIMGGYSPGIRPILK